MDTVSLLVIMFLVGIIVGMALGICLLRIRQARMSKPAPSPGDRPKANETQPPPEQSPKARSTKRMKRIRASRTELSQDGEIFRHQILRYTDYLICENPAVGQWMRLNFVGTVELVEKYIRK